MKKVRFGIDLSGRDTVHFCIEFFIVGLHCSYLKNYYKSDKIFGVQYWVDKIKQSDEGMKSTVKKKLMNLYDIESIKKSNLSGKIRTFEK